MSSKRKLRRAQAQAPRQETNVPNRDKLRRQTADERFAKAGAEKLWLSLLGWNPERVTRIWLAQSVNDAARANDPEKLVPMFAKHAPQAAQKLATDALSTAVDMWRTSGDEYAPDDPAPKWHYLANLCDKLELGSTTPEELQDDWEAWIGLALAAPPRATLMAALAQAEQAAVQLHGITRSDRIGAVVNMSRALWTALAYGDETSFEVVSRSSQEWLAEIAKRKPG